MQNAVRGEVALGVLGRAVGGLALVGVLLAAVAMGEALAEHRQAARVLLGLAGVSVVASLLAAVAVLWVLLLAARQPD